MKKLTKTASLLILCILLISCEKTQELAKENHLKCKTPSIESFSKALSAAVSQHKELRSFIKKEAEKQFDNDNDVFYPFVKDKVVFGNKVFRDYILEHISENELQRIESEHPLLNISVPDWEWLGAFSINTWATDNDSILVGYATPSSIHPVFQNGVLFDNIESGVFPELPILIVKDNERMTITTSSTKATEAQYSFSDEAFNPALNTKVSAITDYYKMNTNPGSEWYDAETFRTKFPEAVAAWEEYGKDPYQAQRNLVYYNMRKGDTKGALNPKVLESILAIKLNKTDVMDDGDIDSRLRDHTYKTAISPTDTTSLIDAIWNSGLLEIKIVASMVKDDGSTQILAEKAISVHAKELFNITKIQRNFYHGTWVSKRKYVYIGRYVDLVPKWYYLEKPIVLNHWSPETGSSIVNVHVYEVDGTKEETVSTKIKKQKGVDLGIKMAGLFDISFNSNAPVEEVTYTYTIKHGSDELYSTEVYYHDYIIKDYADNKYKLKTYNTGVFEFIMVPIVD